MNTFIKNIFSSAIGFVLGAFMMVSLIVFLIIIMGAMSALTNNQDNIKPNSILKLELDYLITDKPVTDPFSNIDPLSGFEPTQSTHLYKILQSIKLAAEDDNISGIFLDLTSFQNPGLASTSEIRDALQSFKLNNKFIYSYATIFSKTSYYLASVADSIFMYPTGIMELNGLSSTTPFFTETMKNIGIKPEIIRHGKFKAAVEPFMLTEMSAENKAQTEILINDIWLNILKRISKDRSISVDSLNTLSDNLMISMLPDLPVKTGLIDGLIYRDELKSLFAKKMNVENCDELNFVSIHQLEKTKNKSKNKIAIIYAEGNIDGDDNNIHSDYTKTIKKVLDNDDIDAVVFRVNSPGGSALISDEILSQMRLSKKEKPIVVSMGNYAASGGYYISCAADKILASENTITGSIGVFGLFFTAEELLNDKIKLHFSNVKTNEFSDIGSVYRSLSQQEKSLLQVSVKNTYDNFINHVSNARKMTLEEVDKIGQGRVWTGERANKIGLIDSIGGLSEAIEIASELAQISDFQIEEFPKQKNGIEIFLEGIAQTKKIQNTNLEQILLDQTKDKMLNMQGIQALLPIKYYIE